MRIGTTSYRNIQNGPQTLRGVRETAIVKPIGEGMKLKHRLLVLRVPTIYVLCKII